MFDAVFSGENETKIKPHPDIFLKTSDAIGVSPKHCIVIEDSIAGVTAAKAAGLHVSCSFPIAFEIQEWFALALRQHQRSPH